MSEREQREALGWMRPLAQEFGYRVRRDVEGWPYLPGRYGRVEWHDGVDIAVYTTHRRLFRRLWAIPGMRKWQVGDDEVRGLVRPQMTGAAGAVLRLYRRPRRTLTPEQARELAGKRRKMGPSPSQHPRGP